MRLVLWVKTIASLTGILAGIALFLWLGDARHELGNLIFLLPLRWLVFPVGVWLFEIAGKSLLRLYPGNSEQKVDADSRDSIH